MQAKSSNIKCIHLCLLVILLMVEMNSFAQNVGIGTLTPAEKLEVVGNIKSDTLKSNEFQLGTNSGNGKILTSDDFGNASWQMSTANNTNQNFTDGNEGFGSWGDCSTYPNITGYHPVASLESNNDDNFGVGVSISGNYAIVGASGDSVTLSHQGSALIYFFNGNEWSNIQQLVDPEAEPNDYFGSSVFISADFAIVGSRYDDVEGIVNQGSACIFQFDGTSWVFMEKMVDPEGQVGDGFGITVSLSGDFAIVGSPYDDETYGNQGSASIFHFNGTNWEFVQKLIDPIGSAGDFFGSAVSIDGEFIMVGCPNDDGAYLDQGSVNVFQYNGIDWQFFTKLLDSPQIGSGFGSSVSLEENYAVIGSPLYSSTDAGQASIYWYNGSSWILNTHLSQPTSDVEYFGASVSLAGQYVIIGTPFDVTSYGQNGSASLYFKVGSKWTRMQFILDPYGQVFDYFGGAVSIDDSGRFLIGAPLFNNSAGKAVFGKVK